MVSAPDSKSLLLSARDVFWQTAHKRFSLSLSAANVYSGDLFGVVGNSGSGKSTLLGLLSLALRPQSAASLEIMGQACADLWNKGVKGKALLQKRRTDSIGFIPQTAVLMPFLTARENIYLSLKVRMPSLRHEKAVFKQAGQAHLKLLTEKLQIKNCLDQYPETLSVGQRQRVAVARALIHNPAIILADEPTAALHQEQGLLVMALLAERAQTKGCGVIVVSHDLMLLEKAGFQTASAKLSENNDKGRHTDFVLESAGR